MMDFMKILMLTHRLVQFGGVLCFYFTTKVAKGTKGAKKNFVNPKNCMNYFGWIICKTAHIHCLHHSVSFVHLVVQKITPQCCALENLAVQNFSYECKVSPVLIILLNNGLGR